MHKFFPHGKSGTWTVAMKTESELNEGLSKMMGNKTLLNTCVCQAPSLQVSALASLAKQPQCAAIHCSHPRQPSGAGGEAMGWTIPPHHNALTVAIFLNNTIIYLII
jgi:hypothetical protein